MRPNGVKPEAMKRIKFYARVLKEIEKLIPQGVTEREAKKEVFSLMNEHLAKVNLSFPVDDFSHIPIKCSSGKCRLSTNPVLLDAALRNINELLNESSGRFDGQALFIYGAESNLKVYVFFQSIKKKT
ncbi:hypothetical protein AVEN_268648-1 [Araneus ventricosus]|uniref:Uncharacterized protein n=1 Tax=Araneus ventricosus TaxID=182803 RepID=A0A4Y2TC60_ARAVE|nr:hypothetical protein AVEN_268648-1 [Araneus ventricosus]